MKYTRALIKGTNWALAGLLTMLGFSTCDKEGKEMMVEYGTPHANFTLKGKVTDEQNAPLEDIKIIFEQGDDPFRNDSINTDRNGLFSLKTSIFPADQTFRVVATDIDGDMNGGRFGSDTTEIKFERKALSGGDNHWYKGEAEKEINIKLKKEADE